MLLTLVTAHRMQTFSLINIKNTDVDTSVFTAHSTRHASTSAAKRRGVDLDLIRKTAGWTKN